MTTQPTKTVRTAPDLRGRVRVAALPLTVILLAALLASGVGLARAAGAADTLELRGTVRLTESGRPAREPQPPIVYFTSRQARPVKPLAQPAEIVTVRKEFNPRIQIVPVGSTVRFPNQDNILHNVFSISGKNRFDLGLYRRGEGKEATFVEPGITRVFCNVHHVMVAYVVVVDTPFYTRAGADGTFVLSNLPPGPGTLTVWHERSEVVERELTLPAAQPVEVELAISRPRLQPHLNKFGRPYERQRGGRNYN